jgi:putative endonuclease
MTTQHPKQHKTVAPSTEKKRLGQWGENVACAYLIRQGYSVLERNWRVHHQGEIDIIAHLEGTLVFIEVKTRRVGQAATGLEALTPLKKASLATVVASYLQQLETPYTAYRVDWLLVTPAPEGGASIHHTEHLELFD